ncbi:MAG: adenylate/guanylate cyclase domain-containing protein [Desulfohalobiaceae bacterium]
MICSNCRSENPEHAKYCMNCGQEFGSHCSKARDLETEGERKHITALFSDLSGYTAMTEKLEPEELKEMKSRLYAGIRRVVDRYEGFIENIIGDGVLVVFGFPKAHEDTPSRAIQAAIDIHRFVDSISPRYEAKLDSPLFMHSGMNTGLAVTGDMQSEKENDVVTGEVLNVAARLSAMAQAGEVIVGPETYKSAMNSFPFQKLPPAHVKGKKEPVHMYKLLVDNTPAQATTNERQVSSELVGRDQELSTLKFQVQKAIQGHGSVVNVMGEPGIGKSRLVAELKKLDVMNQVVLLEGRAISIGKSLSFYPIVDLLGQWARLAKDDTEASAVNKLEKAIRMVDPHEADEILPFVATLMGIKLTGGHAKRVQGIEGEALEKLIIKNIRELMIKISEMSPTIFVMEDLQWADASSIELLDALYKLAEKHRLIFINVFRPSYLEDWHDKIVSISNRLPVDHVQIELAPLDRINSIALINNMLHIEGLPSSVKDTIMDRTDGNPFFIEELVRYLIDEGVVVATRNGFQVTDRINSTVIPATIHDVLMSRIDRLEERTKELVKIASVIGRCFFDCIIKDVADSINDVDSRLAYLQKIQLIRDRRHMDELEYVFKHALAQEAAYASTLLQQRKALHLKVGQSIERIFQGRLTEFYGMLAFHYSKGEDLDKAETYMTKAGEEALKASASSEALYYYKDVIKLYTERYGESIDPDKMADLESNLAFAFYYKGNKEEAIKYFNSSLYRLGIKEKNTQITILSEIIVNLLKIVLFLYLPLTNGKNIPTYRENKILNIILAKGQLLAITDAKSMFANTVMGFKKCFKFDLAKSQAAFNGVSAGPAIFSLTGISFSIGKKSLQYAQRYLSRNDNKLSAYYYKMFETMHNYFTGNWDHNFGDEYIDYDIEIGEINCASGHLLYMGYIDIERGCFHRAMNVVDRLNDISEEFNSDYASVMYYTLLGLLLKKQKQFIEAIAIIDDGLLAAQKIGFRNRSLSFLGMLLQIQVKLSRFEDIDCTLKCIKEYISNEKRIVPYHYSCYILGLFLYHLYCLENAIHSQNMEEISKYKNLSSQTCLKIRKNSKKVISVKTQAFCLMGRYYWILNKQRKALRWWEKSIQVGEKLGARPDLSRTYFEVGKRLLESQSKYKTLNGKEANHYLNKARELFEEMNLKHDLAELRYDNAVQEIR